MEMLIKDARIVDYANDFAGDIYVKDGIITEIGKNLNKNCSVINAGGKVLMPAFVDLHSHFRDPGLEYKEDIETGSRAAVRGGYTAVNLMPNTKPVCSDMKTVDYVLDKAKKVGLLDVHQAASITKDLEGTDISHLEKLTDAVKCISDDGKGVYDSVVMLRAMEFAAKKGLVVMAHEEDAKISPISQRLSENLMTARDIALAKHTGCHLHVCHVSTKEAMDEVVRAKMAGYKITCEITPHHVALTDRVDYKVNPPLRSIEDVKYIVNCIKGGFVDAIGTDHAPHTAEDKKNGACGISGIETAFSVCYTSLVKKHVISLNKLSELMSKNPAEILRINKGKIEIGCEGDFVLVDVSERYTVDSSDFQSKGKNTPFDGMELYGTVLKTIKGGKVVYERNKKQIPADKKGEKI